MNELEPKLPIAYRCITDYNSFLAVLKALPPKAGHLHLYGNDFFPDGKDWWIMLTKESSYSRTTKPGCPTNVYGVWVNDIFIW